MRQLLEQPLGDKEIQFRKDVLAFMTELCSQIHSRFPMGKNSALAQMHLLSPELAMQVNRPSVIPLAALFPNVVSGDNLDVLSDQWRQLPLFRDDLGHLLGANPPQFWLGLQEIKYANDARKFDVLTDLMTALLALPHSSACVERVFSKVNLVKTKQTNKLSCGTVSNRILAKQAVARQQSCYNFAPSKHLVKMFVKDIVGSDMQLHWCNASKIPRCPFMQVILKNHKLIT